MPIVRRGNKRPLKRPDGRSQDRCDGRDAQMGEGLTRRRRGRGRRRLPAAGLGLLMAGLGLAPPAFGQVGDRLTGYGKLLFGMTTEEVQALTGQSARQRPDGADVIETPEKIAGMPATRTLVLADGRLASIMFQWTLEAAGPGSETPCQGLFDRLLGQVTGRYGQPAIGSDPEGQGGAGFAGTSFWSFPDGASIGLVVRGDDGATGCRATVNYKEPPLDDVAGDEP